MTTITHNLDQLYKMLSAASDQPKETEFGELLIKIIKKPTIPDKELLFHPSPTQSKPGQPNRLRHSKLSNQAYAEVREHWAKIIADRNRYPDSHGLSYDLFMRMIRDLYGCEDVRDPEMPITREAVNHLVQTGNPWKKSKVAVTLQEPNLKFLSCFTQDYSFGELKNIGEKVVSEYQEQKGMQNQPVKLQLDFKNTANSRPNEQQPELYLSHDNQFTTDPTKANNLRALILNRMQEKGSRYFLSSGLPLEDIFTLLADENPRFSKETLVCLPELLGISFEEFIMLLKDDKSKLDDIGF